MPSATAIRCAAKCGSPTPSARRAATRWPARRPRAASGSRTGCSRASAPTSAPRVSIGAREFVVERVLEHRPDQSLGFDTFAPSLMMNLADLESTELIRPGSRATYAQLFAGDAADVAAFREWFETSSGDDRRLQTAGRSEERIDRAIERAEQFLSLASMIALLLAATAVAVSARRYAAQQVEGVALMKCLGASQALVLAATLLELAHHRCCDRHRRQRARLPRTVRAWHARRGPHGARAAGAGLGARRQRHLRRARGARRVRDARDAVAAHRAAAARAAPGCGAESRADGRVVRGRGRRRARPARVARRHQRDARRVGRRAWRRRRAALCRGARARQAHRAAAQRRGCRVALWAREHRTPPRRQRRAGDGVRLRAHGAAAPVGRADRPARHVVRVSCRPMRRTIS